jgi:hypothetical protein
MRVVNTIGFMSLRLASNHGSRSRTSRTPPELEVIRLLAACLSVRLRSVEPVRCTRAENHNTSHGVSSDSDGSEDGDICCLRAPGNATNDKPKTSASRSLG